MQTKTVLIDQTGNRFQASTSVDNHAYRHKNGGSDPVTVNEIGGLSSVEIYQLFKRVERTCSDYTDFYALLKERVPIGPGGKISWSYMPDGIVDNGYIEYVATFPGTLKTVNTFDVIPVRARGKVVGASATIASKPDADIAVTITTSILLETGGAGSGNLITLIDDGGSNEHYTVKWPITNQEADVAYPEFEVGPNLDGGRDSLKIGIDTGGASNPGEFLTVRVLTKLTKS